MEDPHIAADGFTYEGEAIRAWLNRGRDTSPLTNLRLAHNELTPKQDSPFGDPRVGTAAAAASLELTILQRSEPIGFLHLSLKP